MKKLNYLGHALLSLFLLTDISAQDCDGIIRHGIRNIERSMSTDVVTATKYQNHCRSSFSEMTDKQLATVEIEIYGSGSGGGSYSRKQREERLVQWCKSNSETYNKNSGRLNESSLIYGEAVQAWSKCNELVARNVKFNYSADEENRTIDISMSYPDGSSGISLTGVQSEGFKYEIRALVDDSVIVLTKIENKPIKISNYAVNIRFTRNEPVLISENEVNYKNLERASISIQTTGPSFSLYYSPEQIAIPGLMQRGIGEVVASFLHENDFKNLYNVNGQKWILANGDEVPIETTYRKYIDEHLPYLEGKTPNLCGVFLRGKNYDRDIQEGNIDLPLGSSQTDGIKKHSHKFMRAEGGVGGILKNDSDPLADDRPAFLFDDVFAKVSGIQYFRDHDDHLGNETRPKNVTVNYFIRVH